MKTTTTFDKYRLQKLLQRVTQMREEILTYVWLQDVEGKIVMLHNPEKIDSILIRAMEHGQERIS